MKIFQNNKRIFANWYVIASVLFFAIMMFNSCGNDIYDEIKKFSKEEIVYPAKFDTCFVTIGFERAEIDLRKGGRIPASKMNLSKADKMVIIYDEDSSKPKVIEYDSVYSWVNITGLTEPRLYRFKIYTEDQYGSRSTPQEISIVPYTSYDAEVLKQGILDPTTSAAPSALIMEWPTGLNSIMMEYHGLSYEYTDQDGDSFTGSMNKNPRIFSRNLPSGEEVTFNMKYKVLPILEDGSKLLDTVEIEKPFIVKMPTLDQSFIPQELNILKANGIEKFTIRDVEDIASLTYPMNMTTFADLFFFPSIQKLNLTGKGLDKTLSTLTYAGGGMTSIVGGGAWQEFMSPVDKPKDIRSPESLQTLKDLIESGQITNIQYIPNSMGAAFDAFLEPYIQSGVVELLTNNHPFFPNRVFFEPQFFAHGLVQSGTWDVILSHSGSFFPRPGLNDVSKFNSANNVVNGQPVDLKIDQLIQNEGKDIYKVVVKGNRPSVFFALPREWRFDNQRYRYFKFKMFIGSDKSLVTNVSSNNRHIYREPWIRPVNALWNFKQYSDYGQGIWDTGRQTPMTDAEIQNKWHEYTVDMSTNTGADNSDFRNRVYIINFGHEGAVTWTYDSKKEVVIYISDVRLSKTVND